MALTHMTGFLHRDHLGRTSLALDPMEELCTPLRAGLVTSIDPERDSLRFYFLGREWRRRVEHVGAKPAIDPDGLILL